MGQILDIFSKKNIKIKEQEKKEKIIVDYREKNCLVASELIKEGFGVEFKELKIGDYVVKGVAIERKTVSDFISSMLNRRLIKQLEELQQFKKRILIIEGIEEQELYPEGKGINPNAVRGFLLSIVLRYNVPIIFSKDYKDTAKFISVLARKKENETPLNAKKKTLNKKEQKQLILEGFPGVGPKISKKLLKEFKSIKNIINASEEDLQKILGKKSQNIKRIIEEFY
jgi:Fanconi anemia group M protein